MLVESEFSVLSFDSIPIGILLLDGDRGQLLLRCRQDWVDVLPTEDAEIMSALCDDLVRLGRDHGVALLDYLEDSFSHSVRISVRQRIEITDVDDALDQLYSCYVERTTQA
jgi:hypothetical protein